MTADSTRALAAHLEWLGITDCPCDFAWKSLGRLNGAEAVTAWYARQRQERR